MYLNVACFKVRVLVSYLRSILCMVHILPGIEDFTHFSSRFALLLSLLTFWLVASLYRPSSRPSCLELLNCCYRFSAVIYLGESSVSWAWVATKAGQLSFFVCCKARGGGKTYGCWNYNDRVKPLANQALDGRGYAGSAGDATDRMPPWLRPEEVPKINAYC